DRAARLGRYFADHALNAFEVMRRDAAVPGAQRILSWLAAQLDRPATLRRRDLYRPVHLKLVEAKPALALLVEYGYLRPFPAGSPDPRTYAVCPAAYPPCDSRDNGDNVEEEESSHTHIPNDTRDSVTEVVTDDCSGAPMPRDSGDSVTDFVNAPVTNSVIFTQ